MSEQKRDEAAKVFGEGVSMAANQKKMALIGKAAAAFMMNRGDVDPAAFGKSVKRRLFRVPAPNVLTLAATTAFADGSWTFQAPSDRRVIVHAAAIEITNLLAAAGTRTPDGVINQLRLAGKITITKSNGRVEEYAFAAFDFGSTDGMPDGLTTAVYHAVSQRNVMERLFAMVATDAPIDTLESLDTITFRFTGLNGTTCADSASGVAGNLLLLCEDLPNN